MTHATSLLAAVIILTTVAHAADHVTIYVGPVDPTTEFVDEFTRRTSDSIRDIKNSLKGKKGLRVVASRAEADIVLRVLGRHASTVEVGGYIAPSDNALITGKRYESAISLESRIEIEDYVKPIACARVGPFLTWRECAGDVAGQVDRWVKANRETIIKKRQK